MSDDPLLSSTDEASLAALRRALESGGEDPHLGADLGSWHIVRAIGAGGVGRVYLAENETTGATAAVKIFSHRDAMSSVARDRFLRSAKTAAQIAHPNIVRVLDAGMVNDEPYLVMSYVEGHTLKELLAQRGGRLDPGEARVICSQIARALAYLHPKGLVHRDVKPSNVIFAADGMVQLTDFDLVRNVAETASLTRTGTALGTAAYMAPEQVRGDGVGPAADVYSLGALLYELVSGATPFGKGSIVEMAYRILHQDVPSVAEKRDDLAPADAALIMRMLAREAEARPTAQELVALLEGGSTPSTDGDGDGRKPGRGSGRRSASGVQRAGRASGRRSSSRKTANLRRSSSGRLSKPRRTSTGRVGTASLGGASAAGAGEGSGVPWAPVVVAGALILAVAAFAAGRSMTGSADAEVIAGADAPATRGPSNGTSAGVVKPPPPVPPGDDDPSSASGSGAGDDAQPAMMTPTEARARLRRVKEILAPGEPILPDTVAEAAAIGDELEAKGYALLAERARSWVSAADAGLRQVERQRLAVVIETVYDLVRRRRLGQARSALQLAGRGLPDGPLAVSVPLWDQAIGDVIDVFRAVEQNLPAAIERGIEVELAGKGSHRLTRLEADGDCAFVDEDGTETTLSLGRFLAIVGPGSLERLHGVAPDVDPIVAQRRGAAAWVLLGPSVDHPTSVERVTELRKVGVDLAPLVRDVRAAAAAAAAEGRPGGSSEGAGQGEREGDVGVVPEDPADPAPLDPDPAPEPPEPTIRVTARTIGDLDGATARLAWSADGSRLATAASGAKTILVFGSDGVRRAMLSGHTGTVSATGWSADGRFLVSGSTGDHTIRIWDAATARPLRRIDRDEDGDITHVALSPDGRLVASACGDRPATIHDVKTGQLVRSLETAPSAPWNGFHFIDGGRRLVTSQRGFLRVWSLREREPERSVESVWSGFDVSARAKRVVKFSGERIHVHGIPDGELLFAIERTWSRANRAVALHPDGDLVAVAGERTLRIVEVTTGQVVADLGLQPSTVGWSGLRWSPDGTHLAVGCQKGQGVLYAVQVRR